MKRPKTTREAFEEVHYHLRKVFLEIRKALRIDRILNWLEDRLTK